MPGKKKGTSLSSFLNTLASIHFACIFRKRYHKKTKNKTDLNDSNIFIDRTRKKYKIIEYTLKQFGCF